VASPIPYEIEIAMKNLLLLLSLSLFASGNAYAYLDPGTGSMILQSLIAVFVVAGSAVGVFWDKIKSFFTRSKKDGACENEFRDNP